MINHPAGDERPSTDAPGRLEDQRSLVRIHLVVADPALAQLTVVVLTGSDADRIRCEGTLRDLGVPTTRVSASRSTSLSRSG